MHDPYTLVCRVGPVCLWHRDRNGSDGACGWPFVCLTTEQRGKVQKIGEREFVFVLGKHGFQMTPFELILESWQTVAHGMFGRSRWRGSQVTHGELMYIHSLASNPIDNLRHGASESTTPEKYGNFCANILRLYLTYHRPWYKHPRWHFWHWSFSPR